METEEITFIEPEDMCECETREVKYCSKCESFLFMNDNGEWEEVILRPNEGITDGL